MRRDMECGRGGSGGQGDRAAVWLQVFKGEGFGNPIDERHCVNSLSIKFVKA